MKNRLTKIIITISYIIMFIFFIMSIITRNNPKIANIFVYNIISPINSFLYYIKQYIPVFIKYLVLFITPLIIIFFYISYILINKIDIKHKNILSNIFYLLFNLTISFFIIRVSIFYIIPNTSNIDNIYLQEYINKEYTIEDFNNYVEYIYNKVDTLSNTIPRTNNKIEIDNITELSINNLKNISDKYKFLKGIYPTHFEEIKYDQLGMGTGFTSNITHSINIISDLNPIAELNNITHELCHIKGIEKESDAVFCTYEAGIYSKDIISNYAAYYEVFTRIHEILYLSNNEYYTKYEELINNKCINNKYEEFCNYNYKEIKEKKHIANKIYLKTYKLYNKEYLSSIIDNIKELSKYEITIYNQDNNIISINEIANQEYIKVIIDIDNNFNSIQDILINKKELYRNINQTDRENVIYERKGALSIEKYIKPFTRKESLSQEYKIENSYSRSIRLLLEKYDYERNE